MSDMLGNVMVFGQRIQRDPLSELMTTFGGECLVDDNGVVGSMARGTCRLQMTLRRPG